MSLLLNRCNSADADGRVLHLSYWNQEFNSLFQAPHCCCCRKRRHPGCACPPHSVEGVGSSIIGCLINDWHYYLLKRWFHLSLSIVSWQILSFVCFDSPVNCQIVRRNFSFISFHAEYHNDIMKAC